MVQLKDCQDWVGVMLLTRSGDVARAQRNPHGRACSPAADQILTNPLFEMRYSLNILVWGVKTVNAAAAIVYRPVGRLAWQSDR
eukprot:SAG11_NODE_15521_length_575_cov_1.157563_1_plen_84_part_00